MHIVVAGLALKLSKRIKMNTGLDFERIIKEVLNDIKQSTQFTKKSLSRCFSKIFLDFISETGKLCSLKFLIEKYISENHEVDENQ
jgi:hypothetical protein